MTKLRFLAVAALVLAAGCGSKSSDSSTDTSSCSGAIGQGMAAMGEARKKQLDERMGSQAGGPDREAKILERSQAVLDKLKLALTTRCTEDKWSTEALDCFSKVTKREEVQACVGKLPKDQAEKTNAEVMKAMSAGMRLRGPGGEGGPNLIQVPHAMAPGGMAPPGTVAPAGGAPAAGPTPTPAPAPTLTPVAPVGKPTPAPAPAPAK